MTWLLITSVVIRVTLILGAAAALSMLLRRSSAAARHLLWTLAITASLAAPVVSVMVPHVNVRILPAAMAPPLLQAQPPAVVTSSAGVLSAASAEKAILSVTPSRERTAASRPIQNTSVEQGAGYPALYLATLLYIAGALLVLLRLAFGTTRMMWIARRARPVREGAWGTLAEHLAASLGITTPVVFLEGTGDAMPVAWGIVRHRVLLPRGAADWPPERQKVVLLHELAHVKRRDCLTQLAAQIACAVYWFNPLAWLASARLRTEREHACDDLVLASGTRGSEYADHLLDIARSLRRAAPPTWAAVAMAHRSQLEGRLMAILDTGFVRRQLSRRVAVSLGLTFAVLATAVTIITPLASTRVNAASLSAVAPPTPAAQQSLPTPTPTPAPAPSPRALTTEIIDSIGEAIPDAVNDVIAEGLAGEVNGVHGGVKHGVKGGIAGGVSAGVQGGVKGGVRADRQSSAANPKIVAALVEALKDTDADVRKQALFTLAQVGAREAEEPIRAATKDPDAEIRRQAVFALSQFEDPANYEYLASALADQDPSVATQAAFGLGTLGDKRAIAPLTGVLKSSRSADVRRQCAFALGELGDPAAVDALVAALHDEDADVRAHAAFALGQIGDARASDALMGALKDPSPQVRRQAAFALSQTTR